LQAGDGTNQRSEHQDANRKSEPAPPVAHLDIAFPAEPYDPGQRWNQQQQVTGMGELKPHELGNRIKTSCCLRTSFCTRGFWESATYKFPLESRAIPQGLLNWPGAEPGPPMISIDWQFRSKT